MTVVTWYWVVLAASTLAASVKPDSDGWLDAAVVCNATSVKDRLSTRARQLLQTSRRNAPVVKQQTWSAADLVPPAQSRSTLEIPNTDLELRGEAVSSSDPARLLQEVEALAFPELSKAGLDVDATLPQRGTPRSMTRSVAEQDQQLDAHDVSLLEGLSSVRANPPIQTQTHRARILAAQAAALRRAVAAKRKEIEINSRAAEEVRGTLRLAAERVHQTVAQARKATEAEDRAAQAELHAAGADGMPALMLARGFHDQLPASQLQRRGHASFYRDDPACGDDDGQTKCSGINKVLTFGYKVNLIVGIVGWIFFVLIACLLAPILRGAFEIVGWVIFIIQFACCLLVLAVIVGIYVVAKDK